MVRTSKRRGRRSRDNRLPTLKWRSLTTPYPPIEVLSADQLEAIHLTSLRVLAEIGMKVLSPDARRLYENAGAQVDHGSELVRFDPAMIEELLAKAPSEFTVRARNPHKNIHFGANHINFSPVVGPSFVSDLDQGRRAGTYAEFCDFLRLVHSFDVIHIGGAGAFEPMDLPAQSRHLDRYYVAITLHDKIWSASLLGGFRARDGIEMVKIVLGLSDEELKHQTLLLGNINTNSPRLLDGNMSDGLTLLASMGQPVVVTPFTLLGAMAPATIAGALTQQNAEALAGIALTQIINPGVPVVYGGFTSNVDMKTGAPAFGTPEYISATQAGGQLARRYRLPYRSSNTNASNAVDAQAAYESVMSL